MSYISTRRFALLGCIAAALCVVGLAQEQPRKGTVKIPFEFYVGPDKLPAGQYSIELISPTYAMLRSQDGKKQEDLVFHANGEPAKNPSRKWCSQPATAGTCWRKCGLVWRSAVHRFHCTAERPGTVHPDPGQGRDQACIVKP